MKNTINKKEPVYSGSFIFTLKISAVIFSAAIILNSCKKSGSTIHPERRKLVQAVYASGKVFPKNDYKVYAKLPGYVQEIHVHVGDTVHVGQPLITIRSEVSELNVSAAKNQYELARNNAADNGPMLSSLRLEMAAAKTKYELDSTNYSRYKTLNKENAASQLQLEQSKAQFDLAKAAFMRATSNYYNTRDRLRTEAENARIQYEAQQSNRSDYIITAAVNGKVYDITPRVGDLVNSQQPVLEIGDALAFEVELSVDETDISLLKTGQTIKYLLDAYKDREFTGTLVESYPRISPGNKTARVIGSFSPGPDMHVFSGMSVEGNIIISEKENALVIPREYLLPGSTVHIRGEKEPKKVTTGAEDLQYVEILAGVTETDELEK
ncbi:MAG: efflux RND transporter periplasmic adaptor subunit [Bacteroidia bacterium]